MSPASPTPASVPAPAAPSAPTAGDIEAAASRLAGVVRTTPLERCERLSGTVGVPVWLKREDLQLTRSYKLRGAYAVMSTLTADERAAGVVCASAGNHAQGLAWACAHLGIRGRVFLPGNTPRQKRRQIATVGGSWVDQVIVGSSFDEAQTAARRDSTRTGATFVHPFDDRLTIAGQGTVALEILAAHPGSIGTMVVPVGGGGLIAGTALWVWARRPEIRIVGAEPAGAASMRAALSAGRPVALDRLDTFVDGAAVARVGELTYPLVRDLVDEVVTVDEGAVCTEMLDLYQSEGIIAEPAGALAPAAARTLGQDHDGPVVCVVSGGNNDVSRYGEVVERSLVHEGIRHYFLVTFPQEPGALRHFLDDVLTGGEDIVVFEYVKKSNRETGPALVGLELQGPEDLEGLLARMEASPLVIERIPPASPLFTFLL
jgi:threonine dehydratase